MSHAQDESIPLRWVRYDGVYYAALLVPPDEGPVDVPANHSFVFFLDGESGAVVSNTDIERYDAQDRVKASHPAAVAGVALAAQLLAGRAGDEHGEEGRHGHHMARRAHDDDLLLYDSDAVEDEGDADDDDDNREGHRMAAQRLHSHRHDGGHTPRGDGDYNHALYDANHDEGGVRMSALDVLREEDATQMAQQEGKRDKEEEERERERERRAARRREKEARRRAKEEKRRLKKEKRRLARAAVKQERRRSASATRHTRTASASSSSASSSARSSSAAEEDERSASGSEEGSLRRTDTSPHRRARRRVGAASSSPARPPPGPESIFDHRANVQLSALEEEYQRGYADNNDDNANVARYSHAQRDGATSLLSTGGVGSQVWASAMLHHRYVEAWRESVATSRTLPMTERDVRQVVERQQNEMTALLHYLDQTLSSSSTSTATTEAEVKKDVKNKHHTDEKKEQNDAEGRVREERAIATARRHIRAVAEAPTLMEAVMDLRRYPLDRYDADNNAHDNHDASAFPRDGLWPMRRRLPGERGNAFQDVYSVFVFNRLAAVARPCELTRSLANKYREQRLQRDRVIQSSQGLGKTGFFAAPRLMERWLRARELMVLAPSTEHQPVKPTGYVARRYADSVAKVADYARRRLSQAGGDAASASATHANSAQEKRRSTDATPSRRAIVTGTATPFRGTDTATATQWLERWEDTSSSSAAAAAAAGRGGVVGGVGRAAAAAYPAFYHFHTLHTAAAVDVGRPAVSLAEQILHETAFNAAGDPARFTGHVRSGMSHSAPHARELALYSDHHDTRDATQQQQQHTNNDNNNDDDLTSGEVPNAAPLMTPLHIDAAMRDQLLVLDPDDLTQAHRLDRMSAHPRAPHTRHHGVDASSALSSATVPNSLLPSASVAMLSHGSEVYSRSVATSENDEELHAGRREVDHEDEDEEDENEEGHVRRRRRRRGRSLSAGYDSAATSHADSYSHGMSEGGHAHGRRRGRSALAHAHRHTTTTGGRSRAGGEVDSWRSAAKRAILEQLTLYLRGLRGRPAVLSREQFETIARRLLERAVRRESERAGLSLALQANNKAIPFTTQTRDGLKRSVDNYVQRHFVSSAAGEERGTEAQVTEVPLLRCERGGGKERSVLTGEDEETSARYARAAPGEVPLPQPPLEPRRTTDDSPVYE